MKQVQPNELIFRDDLFSPQAVALVKIWLCRLPQTEAPPQGYSSWAQALLDELSGKAEEVPIRNPVSYLTAFINAHRRGTFRLDYAYRILEKRLTTHISNPKDTQ